jgi:tetratricopeptide (TPR) repeat protein
VDPPLQSFEVEELKRAFVTRVSKIKHAHLPHPPNKDQSLSAEDAAVFDLACHAGLHGNSFSHPSTPFYLCNLTASKLLRLARIYISMGRISEANTYCISALGVADKGAVIRALVLMDMMEIEALYGDQETGATKDIPIDYFTEAVSIVSFNWGETHPLLLKFYERMANLYELRGDFETAKHHQEKALFIAMRALGKNHILSAQQLYKVLESDVWFAKKG